MSEAQQGLTGQCLRANRSKIHVYYILYHATPSDKTFSYEFKDWSDSQCLFDY